MNCSVPSNDQPVGHRIVIRRSFSAVEIPHLITNLAAVAPEPTVIKQVL